MTTSQQKPAASAGRLSLRLYVAGQLPHSEEAAANLRTLCAGTHPNPPLLEIVDALREPERALEDHIVATPTLIRLSPAPAVRIFGTLSDLKQVRLALGLTDQHENR